MNLASIRTRFALVIGGTVALSVIVLTVVLGCVTASMIQQTHDLALRREANRVSALLRAETSWVGSGLCEFATSPACTSVIDATTPLGRTPQGLLVSDEHRRVAASDSGSAKLWSEDSVAGSRVRVLTVPVEDGVAVMVASSTLVVDRSISRLVLLLALTAIGLVAAAGAVSAVVAGRLARPLRSLTRTAEHVTSASAVTQRMTSTRRDEVGRLTNAFDTMLVRLESAEQARRDLITDASHDLRTPLAAITTNLELLERDELEGVSAAQVLSDARDDAHDMNRLVQTITDLARAESQPLHLARVSASEVVRDAVAATRRRWRSTDVVVLGCDDADILCVIDVDLVYRALVNVLDNAAKYSPEGARIVVSLERDGDGWCVQVDDSGPGIRDDDLPFIFDRFYQGDGHQERQIGSGIGLAMVKQTLERHGGGIDISTRPDGGTRVLLSFPVTPTATS